MFPMVQGYLVKNKSCSPTTELDVNSIVVEGRQQATVSLRHQDMLEHGSLSGTTQAHMIKFQLFKQVLYALKLLTCT